jgi:ribose transport system ATP-binding protein
MVEIAKALAPDPTLLILDEPTASLTNRETETLFQILMQLREKGVALIYITHRMAEVERLADKVSVLKDGVIKERLIQKPPHRKHWCA